MNYTDDRLQSCCAESNWSRACALPRDGVQMSLGLFADELMCVHATNYLSARLSAGTPSLCFGPHHGPVERATSSHKLPPFIAGLNCFSADTRPEFFIVRQASRSANPA